MSSLQELFSNPPSLCSHGYFWVLNSELDADAIRKTISELSQKGVKIIYPHPLPVNFRAYACSTMKPDYLTEEYFDLYRVMLDECRAHGMKLCLYDEGGFPSGGACGRVLASAPEKFTRRYLVSDGPGKVKVEFEKVDPQRAPLPDILNPDAVKVFLDLTHEEYFRRFGDDFGTLIPFAFMDEPGFINAMPGRIPWCADFPEEFEKRKHYDIRPFLPALLAMTLAPETVQARIDFYDVLSQLLVERFTLPIRKWCREHGILSGGHLDGEDEPARAMYGTFGQVMRVMRTLDMPGVDVIWRQLWQGERLHTYPKFASSVAHQCGNPRVSGELFGVYGAGLTLQQMKFIASYVIVCGINTLVATDMPTSTQGQRMEGQRPFFSNANPLWKYFDGYHHWVAHLCSLSVHSTPCVENALFYDTRSLWIHPRIAGYSSEHQEHIAHRLREQQCDFDFVDDDVLSEALLEDGGIRIGKAVYRRLIVPTGARMSEPARKRLEQLRLQGAEILSSDEAYRIRPLLAFREANPNILLRTHVRPNGTRIHFILNTSLLPQQVSCQLPAESCVIADPETGHFHLPQNHTEIGGGCDSDAKSQGVWSYRFAPGELVVLIIGEEAIPNAEPPRCPGKVLAELADKWSLKKIRQYSVGEDDYVIEEFADAPEIPASTGDWAEYLGPDFSGEAEYALDFDYSGSEGIIDLGKVDYVAAVILNGVELGTRIASPFCFDATGVLHPGRNHLQIRVTNTLTNAITPAQVWEKWKRELPFVSPYEYLSRWFEQESLSSGLFGPVTIRE